MAKLTNSEIEAILKAEQADALGSMNASKLSEDRAKAQDYYQGDMTSDMPAPAEQSQAVSFDVADTVEGLMPSLMDIFCSGDEVVEFQPAGKDDEEKAQQETDYVNHIIMQKNHGFMILYTLIKDALLSKVGIVKVFWEEKEEIVEEMFWGLPEAAYGMLVMNKDLKIVEHTARTGIPGEQPVDEAYA